MKVLHIDFPHWISIINKRFLDDLSHLKVLWSVWNLRGFIIVSLVLQIILILFAPFRKQSSNLSVIVSIWLAYLLADYIATQAVGLIPNYTQKNIYHNNTSHIPHADLLAFWSPFLLVHLGGPDTITALALEDNELWMRTALHLGTQVSATGRVFFQSLPTSLLWLPTVFMFVAGILKYSERMLSLYHARLTKFKSSMLTQPDPGPNYAKLMESYDSYKKSHLPATFDTNPEPDQYKIVLPPSNDVEDPDKDLADDANGSTTSGRVSWRSIVSCYEVVFRRNKTERDRKKLENVQIVREAYGYFQKYKGLYVDMIFSNRDRSESREYFLKRGSKEVFKLIETELNFTYEVFFTKMIVIHRRFGTVIRCISCTCQVFSLLIWTFFITKKPHFNDKDIIITYVLLVGAIVLDVIAILRVLFSDWKVALLNKESEVRAFLYDRMLSVRERTWGEYWSKEECPWMPYLRRVFFRRWSESILQFNLITYSVDPWSKWVRFLFVILPLQDKFDEMAYVSKKWFANDLRNFIFNEIKYKAEIAEDPADAEDVCKSKGGWVLRSLAGSGFDPFVFYPWTADIEYDECLLTWHVATELLYQKRFGKEVQGEAPKPATRPGKTGFGSRVRVATELLILSMTSFFERLFGSISSSCRSKAEEKAKGEPSPPTEDDYCKYSKTLSDYMMYLVNQQPEMMLPVAGISEVRFRDTWAEATKFFDRVLPKSSTKPRSHKEACNRIMQITAVIDPRAIKGDRSKSVLFDARRLAKKLEEIENPPKKDEKVEKAEEVEEVQKVPPVKMWELIAKVWVELVSYSATHCRANSHAAQLKQGGELLTLVWLLMVHLGLGSQYRITQGNARSKLIISK